MLIKRFQCVWLESNRVFCSIVMTMFFVLIINAYGNASDVNGRLRGQVVDETTQSPLIAAAVVIEGTTLGAAVDMDGNFIVENIAPGIYNVRFIMMGYETRVVNNVVINPNRSTWQKIEMKPTVIQSENVTITAGYFHEARDGVVSNRSVDFEELRSDPGGCEDVQRVMQALPSVVSGTDMNNEIIVRGGIPGENLFLMDDIEIPNPNHFADQGTSGGPINMVNPIFVRQIDFYAGAFPARYGDKASSVMDISLRDGNREKLTGHSYMGMAGAGVSVEGPVDGGRGSYLISGRKSYLDLILGGLGLIAVPKYYSIQSKFVYDLDRNNKLVLNALYGHDFIKGDDNDDPENLDQDRWAWKTEDGQVVLGLGWRHIIGKRGYLKTTLSHVEAKWDVWETKNGQPNFNNRSTERERAIKSELVYLPISTIELQTGFQFKTVHFNIQYWAQGDTIFLHQLDDGGNTFSKEAFQVNEPFSQKNSDRSYKIGAFFQCKWHPLSRWTLTAGIRRDYFDFIHDDAIDPRLGIQYQLASGTSINLAVGQQSQTPCYGEITAHPLNRDLDYKRTRQVVLGMERLFREDMRGTIEVFYKDYQKVPIGVAELSPDPFDVSNGRGVSQGEGFAKGVEVFLQKKPTGNTRFTLSYAYSISQAKDPRNDRYYNWDFDYRHMFTAIGGIRLHLKNKQWYQHLERKLFYKLTAWLLPFGDEVEISCRWRYLGGRPYTQPVYHKEYQTWLVDEDIAVNGQRYPAYHRLDVRLDRRFMFSGCNIVTYFDIMNIYNRKNIWEYYYKSDGSIETISQFSLVPIAGITVEF